jgi:hypothetical protein
MEGKVEHGTGCFRGISPSPLGTQQAIAHEHFTIVMTAQAAAPDPVAILRPDGPASYSPGQRQPDVPDPFACGIRRR